MHRLKEVRINKNIAKTTATAACLLITAMSACGTETPAQRDVDRVRSLAGLHAGNGETALLAACAFGYAACGAAGKAGECMSELRKRYPSSPVLELIEPGFLAMPCAACYGLPVTCSRCDGNGEIEMMAGSKPVRCIVCGGSGIVRAGCKVCKDTNRDPMSKEACGLLYQSIIADFENMRINGAGFVMESRVFVDRLTSSVNLARLRMEKATRLRGRVAQKLANGALVRLSEKTNRDRIASSDELVFVSGADRFSSDYRFTRIAFINGMYDYQSVNGDETSVDAYILFPWDGLLVPLQAEREKQETVMGIPRAVYAKIKAKAQDEWPDDFSMQKYRIEREVRSYKALHSAD